MKPVNNTIYDFLKTHKSYVILALNKDFYNKNVANNDYEVFCYRACENGIYADSALLFAQDDNYAYFNYRLENNETFNNWGLIDHNNFEEIFSATSNKTKDFIFIWDGTNMKGLDDTAQ